MAWWLRNVSRLFSCPNRAFVYGCFGGSIFVCSELRLVLKGSRLPQGNREGREHNHWPDVMAFLTLHSQFISRYWDDAYKGDSHSLAMSSVFISSIRPYGGLIFLDQSASIFCSKWCTEHGEGIIGCGWTDLTVSQCIGKVRSDVTESLIS